MFGRKSAEMAIGQISAEIQKIPKKKISANSPPIYLDLVLIHFFGGVEYKKEMGRDVFF